MWVECKLHLFRDNTNNLNSFFPVFRCYQCRKMDHIENLPLDQNREQLENAKCIHSKMADKIVERRGGWDTVWQVDLTEIDIPWLTIATNNPSTKVGPCFINGNS